MTNYNERLDEILSNLYNSAWIEGSNYEENNPEASDIPSKREIAKIAAAKQALASLTKELVAEAKPAHVHGTTVSSGQFNRGVSEFEQNLLKALEEVK